MLVKLNTKDANVADRTAKTMEKKLGSRFARYFRDEPEDKTTLCSSAEAMKASLEVMENRFAGNTTLAVVMTNAAFDKARLCKIAGMAQDGYARSIHPVHTSADGDRIYAVSAGDVKADMDVIGTLAAEIVSEAILRAVQCAGTAYGYPCLSDLRKL